MSWPWREGTEVLRHLQYAPSIIYLGKNSDGISCGDHAFWVEMMSREMLAYSPDRRSTLIVYGKQLSSPRAKVMPEEYAALRRDIPSEFNKLHLRESYSSRGVLPTVTESLFDGLLGALAGVR